MEMEIAITILFNFPRNALESQKLGARQTLSSALECNNVASQNILNSSDEWKLEIMLTMHKLTVSDESL